MEKMWAGRTSGAIDKVADDFNSSISFDCRLYEHDIKGSMAHAAMLGSCNIITASEAQTIIGELGNILQEIKEGKLPIDMNAEDIHMFVESVLTQRLGELGKKLHTARSRNDQVALDMRLYLRDRVQNTIGLIKELLKAILVQAEENKNTLMAGYTHLQRAQCITFAHHILAYGQMFMRDIDRLKDASKRMNVSPIGSCALAGTTYNTNREMEGKALGFDSVSLNSMDGVSDRDFCIELLSALSLIMVHLSRFSEEIILWSSFEFSYIELSDSYTTGSSIMPQKKNPDMAELVRGKTGRVFGDLIGSLTMLKGIPLAYNKDMQEDKESIFDAFDTVDKCLEVFAPMIMTMKTKAQNMLKAAQGGFMNATDLADYLVKKGMAFRDAYKISGKIVAFCIEKGKNLETMTIEDYKAFSPVFEKDLYDAINLNNCVKNRVSYGGTGPDSVETLIKFLTEYLK